MADEDPGGISEAERLKYSILGNRYFLVDLHRQEESVNLYLFGRRLMKGLLLIASFVEIILALLCLSTIHFSWPFASSTSEMVGVLIFMAILSVGGYFLCDHIYETSDKIWAAENRIRIATDRRRFEKEIADAESRIAELDKERE